MAGSSFDERRLVADIASDFNLLGRLMYKIYNQHRGHRHLRFLLAAHRSVRKLLSLQCAWTSDEVQKLLDLCTKAGESLRQIAAMGHWLPFCLASLGVLARWHKHLNFLVSSQDNKERRFDQIESFLRKSPLALDSKGSDPKVPKVKTKLINYCSI